MWVFTQDGYVSVVDNKEREGLLSVRARDRQSLISIAEIASQSIEFTPYRDYEYRTYATREQFAEWLALNVEMLNYHNFKDQVHKTLGDDYYHACGEVWVAMTTIKDDEAQDWYRGRYASRSAS
jgi:hypothetical protein